MPHKNRNLYHRILSEKFTNLTIQILTFISMLSCYNEYMKHFGGFLFADSA